MIKNPINKNIHIPNLTTMMCARGGYYAYWCINHTRQVGSMCFINKTGGFRICLKKI
jgi:hypothetical protein